MDSNPLPRRQEFGILTIQTWMNSLERLGITTSFLAWFSQEGIWNAAVNKMPLKRGCFVKTREKYDLNCFNWNGFY